MKRVILAGLVLGAISGVTATAVASMDSTVDRAHEHPIEGEPLPGTGVTDPPRVTATWLPARADAGPLLTIAQVKKALTWMLGAELQASAMPASIDARRETSADRRQRASSLEDQLWDASVVVEHRDELLAAIDLAEADPTYLSYTESRFVVTDWQGVTITREGATATLVGHDEFRNPGEQWSRGRGSQHQIELAHGDGGWRMVARRTVDDETDGS